MSIRTARLIGTPQDLEEAQRRLQTIERYLPDNYTATLTWSDRPDADPDGEREILITGEDFAGWTLDAYILPRLASGLHWAEEVLR